MIGQIALKKNELYFIIRTLPCFILTLLLDKMGR